MWAHIDEAASHLLDDTITALEAVENEREAFLATSGETTPSSTAFSQLAEAAWWLEMAAAHDPGHRLRVERNLGIAYAYMLRIKVPSQTASHTLVKLGSGNYYDGMIGDAALNVTKWYDDPTRNWREWAAEQQIGNWATYLARAEAKKDWDYGRIQQLYALAHDGGV